MAARQHRQLPSKTFLNLDARAFVDASVACSCIKDQSDYFVANLPRLEQFQTRCGLSFSSTSGSTWNTQQLLESLTGCQNRNPLHCLPSHLLNHFPVPMQEKGTSCLKVLPRFFVLDLACVTTRPPYGTSGQRQIRNIVAQGLCNSASDERRATIWEIDSIQGADDFRRFEDVLGPLRLRTRCTG